MGTSGGIGVKPGTLIVTERAFSPLLKEEYQLISCGKSYSLTPKSDPILNQQLLTAAGECGLRADLGNTISTDDYYEAQARMDGAFCNFSAENRREYLMRAHSDFGVKNFEMEATLFLAFCHRAGISGAVFCVSFLDRLKGDRNAEQQSDEDLGSFEERPLLAVMQFIKNQLNR